MDARYKGVAVAVLAALAVLLVLASPMAGPAPWVGLSPGRGPLATVAADAPTGGHTTGIEPMWSRAALTIVDGTATEATTGDPFTFNTSVQGGTGVSAVRVVLWFADRTAEARNESMASVSVDAGGNGTYNYSGLVIPSDSLDPLNYNITARSRDGTWTTTMTKAVVVLDNDFPTFERDLTDAVVFAGGTVRFEVEVKDNVGISKVYWMNKTALSPIEMSEVGADIWASSDIQLSRDTLKDIEYKFIVVDSSGNVQHSPFFNRTPVDRDPPVIVADRTNECVKGLRLNLSVEAADNIVVSSAHVTYWYGTTPSGNNVTMTADPKALGMFMAGLDVPRHPSGTLRYIVSVTDGRFWTTGPVWERTPVNRPPRPLGQIEWNVTEGAYDWLDLTEHIVDDNDPLTSLTVSCTAPNVDVDGLILHARYDVPVADHPVLLHVSDGEDSTDIEVWVHIIPTNDAPVITSTPPTTGQVNVTYTYKMTYTDEERDDTHTFSLTTSPEGMTVGTDGTVTWRPTRAQHDNHDVDLTVSDGLAIVHQLWTIRVTPGPDPGNSPPYFVDLPPRVAEVGAPYSWDADAIDPDADDTLYFHLLTGPSDAEFDNATGTLTWTPQYPGVNVSVDVSFEVEVTDGHNRIRLPFVVRVRSPADMPPEIKGYIADMTISGLRGLDLSAHMYDPDDPVGNLTWRVEVEDPDLLTGQVDLRKVWLEPAEGAEGTTEVVLYLEDPSGLSDRMSFSVRVEGPAPAIPIWLVVIILVVVVVGSVGVISWRRGAKRTALAAAGERPAVIAEVEGKTAPGTVPSGKPTHIIEEVLVVYHDGRLIADCAREECKTKDADLMSGMLITIQGIIQDGLERGGALESIKYGENIILMACGSYIDIAVVIYGEPDGGLRERVEALLARIEGSYAGVVEDWTGDLAVFDGIDAMTAPLLKSTAGLGREDIAKADVFVGVTLLSAVDFHRGYVRLKVATLNATKDVIVDAAIEVRYDPDMLRLERLDPSSIRLRGDKAILGNVKPGEKKTVAFLFDPQICQETHIDGTLSYCDTKGEVQRVDMKRRQADVVCPIFFTKEHANTAMLRRLIKEKLDQSDVRLFTFPPEISPEVALVLGKSVAGGDQVQLVREFVVEGPPFEAEVWYYGETRVKGYQMVMRLSVLEEKHAIEYFAASTGMEPVTGLLAEFRRDLEQMLEERYAGQVKIKTVRDEVLKREVEMRQLFLFTFGEREEAGA